MIEVDWEKAAEWDAGAAHEELEQMAVDLAAKNADVRKLLSIQGERSKSVRIEGRTDAVEFRVVAVVPWDVRTRLAKMATEAKRIARQEAEDWQKALRGEEVEIEDPDPIAVQRPMYEIMADLCLDEPWNDWQTWAALDVRTGAAPEILEEIMKTIAPEDDRIRSFRKKR